MNRTRRIVGAAGLCVALVAIASTVRAAGETVSVVDSSDRVGFSNSLVLDADGLPIISYYDDANRDLKIVHCNDVACAGGDESIRTVESDGDVGLGSSLALDVNGYPVVSYTSETTVAGLTNGDLKVLHCNDAACAGGDDTIRTVDADGDVQIGSSLKLDASGFPVIVYYDHTTDDPKIVHCNDPLCDGGDEEFATFDVDLRGGASPPSLALDADGFPVIGFWNHLADLTVVHCNDPACGGDDDPMSVAASVLVAGAMTMVLDAAGLPVIAFGSGFVSGNMMLARCNDSACAGGDETVRSVATGRPDYVAAALDAAGNPVVSYFGDFTGNATALTVAHCNDPQCDGGNESIHAIESPGGYGSNSMRLDAAGFPVVSFYDFTNGDLLLARCADPACSSDVAEAPSNTLPSTGSSNAELSISAICLVVTGAGLMFASGVRRRCR